MTFFNNDNKITARGSDVEPGSAIARNIPIGTDGNSDGNCKEINIKRGAQIEKDTLENQISYALMWNALLFVGQRLGTLLVTSTMYTHTTIEEFSGWATINSTIFLWLLWIDCGFKKSIARHMPAFEKYSLPLAQWFIPTITIQMLAATLCTLWFAYTNMLYLYIGLFITQAASNIVRHIAHAQMQHKWFNTQAIIVAFCESAICYYVITFHKVPNPILTYAAIKVSGAAALSIIAFYRIIMNETVCRNERKGDTSWLIKSFVTYSCIMGITTILKSISERNAIMIGVMHIYGAGTAAMIKIAQEVSLVLYRTIIKTIGTIDTFYLSQIHINKDTHFGIEHAVTKLTIRIAALSVPFLGIIIYAFLHKLIAIDSTYVFQLIIIMSISYLIETLFTAYERVIEIKNDLLCLTIVYGLYTCASLAIYYLSYMAYIGPLLFISLLHVVRLVSLFLFFIRASYYHNTQFPYTQVLRYVFFYFVLFLLLSLISYKVPFIYSISRHITSLFLAFVS